MVYDNHGQESGQRHEMRLPHRVLTIILAAAISGVCSAGPDESRLEQVKAGIRRYAIPPLELRLPPPPSPLNRRWFSTAIAA